MNSLRWLFLGLVLATTAAATTRLLNALKIDGLSLIEVVYLILVAILFFWISASFWMASIGAYARWRRILDGTLQRPRCIDASFMPLKSRTAILFPIRNEDSQRIFAGVRTVCDSIRDSGAAERYDVFILSDSNDDEHLAAEAGGWCWLQHERGPNVHYRHREDNSGRKSGNIAEFCRNWGAQYDYMVILDADSLMTGATLAALVQIMDANPRAALIQAPPQLVGRDSLFARIQQFASSVYGPLYAAGQSLLQGPGGNYWGHNAIIRVQPFMTCCGLPKLPGRAPLGGEIMSHDFVEAALLRRAGWGVHLVTDLDGSYEEPPPTFVDHLIRDRRWCQGNLQHSRLILGQGFRTESRGHFLAGVMSYVSSPLWLAMLIASVFVLTNQPHVAPVTYVGRYPLLATGFSHSVDFVVLLAAMIVLLYGPKILALLLVLRDREGRHAHGGTFGVIASVILEAAFSTLVAPIAMLSQSAFVIRILLGETKGWGVQRRAERRMKWPVIARAFAAHTFVGVGAGLVVYRVLPISLWLFLPLVAGPVVAIPLVRITSSVTAGRLARGLGLFVTPGELGRIPIVDRVRAAMQEYDAQ
jgi:membrane glycosyltransferase